MTAPTISYGPGFITDCTATTEYCFGSGGNWAWTYTDGGIPTGLASNGDVFTITATTDDVGVLEYAVYIYPDAAGANNLNISITTYPKYRVRYKTSASGTAPGFRMGVIYSCGETVYLTGSAAPQFSTTWKVESGNITACSHGTHNINHVFIEAKETAIDNANGTYYVYVDFIQFFQGTFTFPYVGKGGVRLSGANRDVDIPIWGRVGDITQYGGAENAIIEIMGDMDTNVNWAPLAGYTTSPDTVPGDIFIAISHKASTEWWQWLDCSMYEGKARLRNYWIEEPSEDNVRYRYHLLFKEYRLGGANSEDWFERFQYV